MTDAISFHSCEISDSNVAGSMKLSNGKNGNGEGRLFISNSVDIMNRIISYSKMKVEFDDTYIDDLQYFVKDNSNFNKKISDRTEQWKKSINNINGCFINIISQNGNTDVNRHYLGQDPHRHKKQKTKNEKDNIKRWDILRSSLVPTLTTLHFFDTNEDYVRVVVTYNKNVHKYNIPSGCSFVSMAFLNTFGKTNNIAIQHSMNGGEHKERNPTNGYFWPVDGYHNCSVHKCNGTHEKPCLWNNYVFEFQGTYWHKDKKEKDLAKKEFYLSKGYNWFEINESEWTNRKKVVKAITCRSQGS